MPKLFSKIKNKKFSNTFIKQKLQIRALWSKVNFSFFFTILKSKNKKWTYFLCPIFKNGL